MTNSPADPPGHATTCALPLDAVTAEILRILDQHMEDLQAGRAATRAELVARHPHLASQLDACLAGLEFIHGSGAPLPGNDQRLGDFQIIREVGRGGMGAVYQAEQISLRRIVALKIMRFGSVSDPEAIERFQREAETVANFHHTNIVPIFAVGVDHGVNYYAMQFIEGQSLAQVLQERQQSIGANEVAEWGLQASEALSHAHARGVVHRDVKPSNLLLDAESRIWLTDFGLARKLDNVTLSIAGAIIGTPRYMSPEQAAAAIKRVDYRSDIFSLGATLYELLTGVPAFRGDTPIEVIQNILTVEPEPVRQLSSAIDRDLETIVMKCLAKEPHERYDSASALSADLRAFIDGRPIQARRANVLERSVRWLRRQQKSVKLSVAVAAVTVLATFASIAGWLAYDASRQGTLQFSAVTPPLLVEILDQANQPLRIETAPMQNPAKLPAGDYRIRVSTEGELSESYDVALAPGQDLKFTLDPHDQLLWREHPIERSFDIAPFENSHAIIAWTKTGLDIWKGFPRQTLSISLEPESLPRPAEAPGLSWVWNAFGSTYAGYGPFDLRPWVAQKDVDVDGDGQLDLIFAARHQAWLAAVSVSTGQVLWLAARGRDVTSIVPPVGSPPYPPVISTVMNDPLMDHDCDGDGVPDLIVMLAETESSSDLNFGRPEVRNWIEAISSATGQTIWRFDLPAECLTMDANEMPPRDLRWYVGLESGYSTGGTGSVLIGRHRVRFGGWKFERRGWHGYRPAGFAALTIGSMPRVGIVAGTTFFSLDPMTGVEAHDPIDLEVRPGRACQWGDLDGDGNSDMVMLEAISTPPPTPTASIRLVAWSPSKRKQLWTLPLDAEWPRMPAGSVEPPNWPLVCDLDGDGKCEVIAPDGRSPVATGNGAGLSQIPWGTLRVFDGATGQTRWTQRLVNMDCQIDHFIDGPDIDQDGCRDLFVATLIGDEFRVYVDAFSGRSGNQLWTTSTPQKFENHFSDELHLMPLKWWNAGNDGWPQLLVQVVAAQQGKRPNIVLGVAAQDGHVLRVGHDITSLQAADMDGDGVEDLLVYNSNVSQSLTNGGFLHCLRGVRLEPWAVLGDRGEPLSDCNGDGVRDLISGWPNAAVEATSGSSGKRLWRTEINSDWREFQVRSAAAKSGAPGDLDGDGICDLLGWTYGSHYQEKDRPFFALSGKTGKRLWTANEIAVQTVHKVLTAEAHDLDGDGQLEVLFVASLDYGYHLRSSISTQDSRLWMFACSGQTGKLRWAIPLSSAYDGTQGTVLQVNLDGPPLSPTVADLDGDGLLDFCIPVVMPDGLGLKTSARRGTDGGEIWSRPYPTVASSQVSLSDWIPPTVCDLDGDGDMEVVAVEADNGNATETLTGSHLHVIALAGENGSELWNSPFKIAVDSLRSHSHSFGQAARAHVLRANDNCHQIAVMTPGAPSGVSVFDAAGVRQDWGPLAGRQISGLWVCDADRDGRDDIVILEQNMLGVVTAAAPERPRWTYSLPSIGPHRVLGIKPADGIEPAVIAIGCDASDNSVLGISLATGERVWSVAGVIAQFDGGAYLAPRRLDWLNEFTKSSAIDRPYIYCSYDSVSRVRSGEAPSMANRLEPTRDLGRQVAAGNIGSPRIRQHVDERWARDLPWVSTTITYRELFWNIAWLMSLSALLVVIPLYFLYHIVRRQFSLHLLLGLPVVASLFLMAILMKIPIAEDVHTLGERFGMAAIYAPLVASLGLVVSWGFGRRWRRLAAWLLTTIVASLASALLLIWADAVIYNPMLPEERYRFQGWPLVWLIGTYATAWLMLLTLLFLRVWQWLRKRFGSSRGTNAFVP
ncbi:serine/threonine protein kinase [Aureliella helgolandensis]|uniref:non-specific serine/threonine protein kinase n=1 Tax=Aureliella helgolandensis TaxID=2527968 RepID=A0A518G9J1_9BACT|nr:serine/threonine-protein kinase [Aureliella helgolandensis]QDV25264.1 Serine/threonine-protein kinase PrkC [Aureliella helgolandensis]